MREYTVSGANITVANQAVTLVGIMPVAGSCIEILRCWVSQHANATSAQQRILLGSKATAFQTVVSATPAKTKLSDPASGIAGATTIAAGACGINASAEGAGVLTAIVNDAFNVLNGYLWIPTPRETIIITGTSATAFTLQFPAAPTTLTGWNFGVTYAELG
jgi:alanine dehydrogenase